MLCWTNTQFDFNPMVFVRRKELSRRDLLQQELDARRDGWVTKRYKDKIVFAKRPEKLSGRTVKEKRSALQKERQALMKDAVRFGKHVNSNPAYKAAWKKHAKGYSNVYQAAVAWYLKNEGNTRVLPPHLK